MDTAALKAELLALLRDDPAIRAALREAVKPPDPVASARAFRDVAVTRVEAAVEPDADPRSEGVTAAVAQGKSVPGWLRKMPHEKA